MRDDYAKAFLFEHRAFLGIAGVDADTVWDNARDHGVTFNHATAIDDQNHPGTAAQWRSFWVGENYSIMSLLKVALQAIAEFRDHVQNPHLAACDHAGGDDAIADCKIDALRQHVFTTDALGGTAIWYMKMRRMRKDDLAGVHNTHMYYAFEGDAARESFFPFGM